MNFAQIQALLRGEMFKRDTPEEKTEPTEVDAKVAASVNRDQAVGSAL